MYLSKEMTRFSLKSIGLHFGGRDHTTVIHAVHTIQELLKRGDGKQRLSDTLESLRKKSKWPSFRLLKTCGKGVDMDKKKDRWLNRPWALPLFHRIHPFLHGLCTYPCEKNQGSNCLIFMCLSTSRGICPHNPHPYY